MDDVDKTFERLKRSDYETVERLVGNRLTVNPYTFELTLYPLYHNIVTGCGWNVEEFIEELNHRKFT